MDSFNEKSQTEEMHCILLSTAILTAEKKYICMNYFVFDAVLIQAGHLFSSLASLSLLKIMEPIALYVAHLS